YILDQHQVLNRFNR
uniref:Uncharacterized protein n=1 Tax=Glossina morsitans morsitans TaxID=37546 RepID=A0A1B0GFV0_GLOMM